MLVTHNEQLLGELKTIAEGHGGERSALMPMLEVVQKKQSRISEYMMQMIADILDIHPVEVYGVVSFYHFLNVRPKGKFIVRLCRTISCDMAGKERVARQLENDLGIKFGETTPDGKFTLEWASCIGMCDEGPALLVNDKPYAKVTPEKVHEILDECRKSFGPHEMQRKEVH
jgi:[NiFe] hydrogenase diaphorase moiety large subunit